MHSAVRVRAFFVCFLAAPLFAQPADGVFFEAKIRPVLATKCYACHSSKLKAPMGGLVLDTKAGLTKGGATGPAVNPGKPEDSRLLQALRYINPSLQMPPSGRLPDSVIADFERWIRSGAPDPRTDTPASQSPAPLQGMRIDDGRKWWAFQPVREVPAPPVKEIGWPESKIDSFLLAKLEQKGLKPSPPADARMLVTRAYIDLAGYKPNYDEVEAFVHDTGPGVYEKLIDSLLESPRYGERWARHWLDVARFAEDNPTSEATNPPYPFAWRYRDWVIEAMNQDVAYDRFVKLQLAADLMPGTRRDDLRALGYLGAAPVYHKDQRLSEEVIGTFLTDDWDERVDAVSRGILGLTVACARCHDHKFDPILTKDYYGLAGVFASTMRAERPIFEIDPKVERRYLWAQRRLFDLKYSADLLTNEASTIENSAPRVVQWKAEISSLETEMKALTNTYPQLVKSLERYWTFVPRQARPAPPPNALAGDAGLPPPPPQPSRRRGPTASTEPFMNAVYDAAQYLDGTDPQYTFINYRPGEARDVPVLLHGNYATPGEAAPRRFLTVLSTGDGALTHGSGRLDLAEKIFSDAAPLSARVIVNRVWDWHFGRPLVPTTSDFGTQGEKASHPELLDDLAARFIAHGWSLKWLHREMMLSAAYRQSSKARPEAAQLDQANSLLWRMNPRRLDAESYRDSMLRATGTLETKMYGPSADLDDPEMTRRSVYGRISRGRLSNLLRLYDFPDPTQTSPGRDLTTTSLQQLFVMNSAFMQRQAAKLAKAVEPEPDNTARIRALYRKALARDAGSKEMDLALSYLNHGTIEQYAQVLLSTNEEIFWP